MIPFAFVTQSTGKLIEVERILGQKLDHEPLDLPEIQSVKVEDVVDFKVRKAFTELRKPVMIEDTGLYIEAWNDLPGALIKWFVQRVEDKGICRMMKDYQNRRAVAQTVVATFDGYGEPVTFVGEVEGTIALAPAGEGGFGWDRIFVPAGATRTFGEMHGEEKDTYSMRCKAFKRMLSHYSNGG